MRTFQRRGDEKWPGIRYGLDAEDSLTRQRYRTEQKSSKVK